MNQPDPISYVTIVLMELCLLLKAPVPFVTLHPLSAYHFLLFPASLVWKVVEDLDLISGKRSASGGLPGRSTLALEFHECLLHDSKIWIFGECFSPCS